MGMSLSRREAGVILRGRGRRRWTTPARAAALAAAALAVAGCDRAPPRKRDASPVASTASVGAPARPLRGRPKTRAELPTTDADIVLGNLDGQIGELDRLAALSPASASLVTKRATLHYARGRYRGDLDELELAIAALDACQRADPRDGACALLYAEEVQSMHRFARAREALARARALGADAARVADLEAELDWNDGRYDAAIAAIRRARAARPSSATWLREAQLEHDLGRYDESDRAFEAAEDLVVDPSPIPLAHMYVQRGVALSQRGRLEAAIAFFREAALRMPTYVAALEHLGEALHALGKDDEATATYERVVALSDDPEFAHALAELYAARGKRARADDLAARAKAAYERLVAKYPEAMYWHAAEYYADVGDRARALDLLQKNAALRPNATSWVALARAEAEAGRWPEARATIDRALATPVVSADLFATASRVYAHGGDAAAAARFADKARAIDPRAMDGDAPPRDR